VIQEQPGAAAVAKRAVADGGPGGRPDHQSGLRRAHSEYIPGDIVTTSPSAAARIAEPMVRWLPQPRAATR
jgi:hypothetical protein